MKKLFNKKLIASSVLAIATVAGAATAAVSYETEWTYYNTSGQVIGGRLLSCSGKVYTWGSSSDNFDIIRDSCFGGNF